MKSEVGWFVAKVRCKSCGRTHISVFPEDIDPMFRNNQECTCGAMACRITRYYTPDKKELVLDGNLPISFLGGS